MALQSAMPNLLTNGHKTPKEETREMLNEGSRRRCGGGC